MSEQLTDEIPICETTETGYVSKQEFRRFEIVTQQRWQVFHNRLGKIETRITTAAAFVAGVIFILKFFHS